MDMLNEIPNSLLLSLFREMLRIRRFEERSAECYVSEQIRGFLHLYIGEEAVAVGVSKAIGPQDNVVATYREHGHALVRGIESRLIMAEMFGKVDGICRGRGGSMHLFDKDHRFFGGNAIVGGGLPLALGLALADKMLYTNRITVVFFGEGAVAEGEFHETMNLAALWKTPVLFVCENNLYAMGTALKRSESQTDLCRKADGYAVNSEHVDGMDVLAVLRAAERAIKFIRGAGGPFFLECHTYRFRPHSMFDPELYRPKEEVEEWKKRDPITICSNMLRSAGILTEEIVNTMEQEIQQELTAAVEFAEASQWEPINDLHRFVYA
jgi:pyruvate dehydrogenase E1 component alpha subunit